jgi:hypothetical protein
MIIGPVVLDYSVFVPAGSANGYGWAQVQAHAVVSGKGGDLATFGINTVENASIYIRNLTSFKGGRDAYSVKVVTPQDRQTALTKAIQQLAIVSVGLHYPCSESSKTLFSVSSGLLSVTWRCQFLTYLVPPYMHVLGTHLQGKEVIIAVWFVAPLKRTWTK